MPSEFCIAWAFAEGGRSEGVYGRHTHPYMPFSLRRAGHASGRAGGGCRSGGLGFGRGVRPQLGRECRQPCSGPGRAAGLAVIPGMEITSAEEVHILGLLPDLEAAMELQSKVYRSLPGRNDENTFGMQVIANEFAEVLGFNEHLLSGATTLNLEEVVAAIHDVDGLAVASHVDREGFGIIGQLGFIPPGLPLDAIEVSQRTPLPLARASFAPKGEYSILCASDAHEPKDVARAATFVLMEEATLGGTASRVDREGRQGNPRRRKADGRSCVAHPGYRAEQPGGRRQRNRNRDIGRSGGRPA